ncbi:MAG: 30S ribosomal protein S21 [Flavobacteriales bacterium]|nr:MAG: 30S ribosomal protein S21 [Flavobacteriales bacterium]
MLIIPVKDGEAIDRALKRYKRKYNGTRVMKSLRARKEFVKPSVSNRQGKLKAMYKQRQASKEEME